MTDQQQTANAFGYKWARTRTYDSPEQLAFGREWLLKRYGFDSALAMRHYFEANGPFLDLGCGAGYTAAMWMDDWTSPERYVGVDISDAVMVARERLPKRQNVEFLQADLMHLPLASQSFRTVFSEGVLHHTPSTKAALGKAVEMLAPGGEILFYVYRKKAPLREFADDYVRQQLRTMEPAAQWAAIEPLTRLGKALEELHATVDLPDGVQVLGIPPGTHDVQRLFYWYIAKAFWNESLSFDANNHINFDWYAPAYAHRQTEEEVREWCGELGLRIERFHTDEAGFTVRARRLS